MRVYAGDCSTAGAHAFMASFSLTHAYHTACTTFDCRPDEADVLLFIDRIRVAIYVHDICGECVTAKGYRGSGEFHWLFHS